MTERHPIFDEARGAVSVLTLAKRVTKMVGMRGKCPLCGTKEDGFSKFSVGWPRGTVHRHDGNQTWYCFGCEEGGDVIGLERAIGGGSAMDAARRLVGAAPAAKPVRRLEPEAPKGPAVSDQVAAELLDKMQPFEGSPAERYLAGRGICDAVLRLVAPNLFYLANAKWGWDRENRRWIRAGAMIAPVVVAGPDGRPVRTGGVHATYLAPGGRGKAALDPAKRMWGPQSLDGKRGVAWLFGDPAAAPMTSLANGEGIETVLSLCTLDVDLPAGAAMAALSLDRLQGGIAKDDDGRIDAFAPQGDPERPPATWPGRWNVVIGVDRDMGPIKVKARTGRGKPCDFELDAEARAALCARLAVRGWKAAGAYSARAVAPPPGRDFNDELKARLARAAKGAT